jgi:hypothetical protein
MLSATVSNADECKFKINESDSFTGQKDLLTKWKAFRPTGNQAVNHGWMAGRVKDGKTFLALRIGIVEQPVRNPLIIPKGAKLLLLMADDSVVELSAYEETWVKDRNVVILYELNDETLGALTVRGTSDIRVSTNQSDFDFNFGNKPTERMRHVLGCTTSG